MAKSEAQMRYAKLSYRTEDMLLLKEGKVISYFAVIHLYKNKEMWFDSQ